LLSHFFYYTQLSGTRRVPSFFLSGFIFDINKVEPHENKIWKIMWIHLRTRVKADTGLGTKSKTKESTFFKN